jgi:hypothetical protein
MSTSIPKAFPLFPGKRSVHSLRLGMALLGLTVIAGFWGCGNLNSGGTSIDTETVALSEFPAGGLPTEQSSGAFSSKDVQANTAETLGGLRVDSAWFGAILRCDTTRYWRWDGAAKREEISWAQAQSQSHVWERRSRLWAKPDQGSWDVRSPKDARWSAVLWAEGYGPEVVSEGQVWYRQRGEWSLGDQLGRFVLDSSVAIVRSEQLEHQGFGRFVDRMWQVSLGGLSNRDATPVLMGPLLNQQEERLGILVWDSAGMRLQAP